MSLALVTGWFHWLFGKPLTPKQMIRQSQRAVNRAVTNIERERYNLERQEQKQIVEMKKIARQNQQDAVRTMAKDLVRTRSHIKKLMKMKANLQGISLQLITLESQQGITQALHQATMILRGMNSQMNTPRIRAILKEFEKQTQIMEIRDQMVTETLDDVMGQEDDDEESDEIVTQVLDELGLQLGQQLPEAPQGIKSNAKKSEKTLQPELDQTTNSLPIDDELLARLDRLRKE